MRLGHLSQALGAFSEKANLLA